MRKELEEKRWVKSGDLIEIFDLSDLEFAPGLVVSDEPLSLGEDVYELDSFLALMAPGRRGCDFVQLRYERMSMARLVRRGT